MKQPHPHAAPARLLPYLYGVGAIFCWASLAAAIGEGLRTLAPETVLFYGLLAAGAGLTLWGLRRGARGLPSWPGWKVALLGVYGIWGYHTLLVLALSMAPLVEANILNYAWPLWIVLLGALLPGHRLTARMVLGGLLGFAGVVLVIGGGALRAAAPGEAMGVTGAMGGAGLAGLALALAAGACWASFTVLLRRWAPVGRETMPLFCLLAVVPAGGLLMLRGAPWAVAAGDVSVLLYFGLVPLALSFLLWERAVRGCNVQVLGLLSFFTPVLSTLMLAVVTGAPVGVAALGGLGLVLAGSLLGSLGAQGQAG